MNYLCHFKCFINSILEHAYLHIGCFINVVVTTQIFLTYHCSLSAATPRGNPRQSRKDGLFISRLSRNTRAIDVMNYIRNEANLNIRCDPIATRYDTYRSYYIHAAPHHHALLLKAGMWPRDVLVKKYNPK